MTLKTSKTAEPKPTADVVVIGAGVVGCAITRELAGSDLRVCCIDARQDVGDATSKANTAILHTGFDAKPGTLESQLVRRGSQLLHEYAQRTGIGVDTTGAVLVAWNTEEQAALAGLAAKARDNGYERARIIDASEVYAMVPDLGPGALAGMVVPDESIICAWSTSLAFAYDAARRGAEFRFGTEVTAIVVDATESSKGGAGATTTVHTTAGPITTRWVINAAGLGGDLIDQMLGFDRFHLNPRRGELLVYDKLARPKVGHIVLPVPSKLGKGVLVSPTIYGNVMVGPTAEDFEDREDTSTTEAGFEFLLSKGRVLMPSLADDDVTAAYAGSRAASDLPDYLIDVDASTRYAVVGGIRSTGLTSSMAIGEYLAGLLREAGLAVSPRDDLPDPPAMPPLAEHVVRPYADEALIKEDSAYGQVVCFCERATLGEIRDAFGAPIPPRTLGGLRRRTRAMNGRCQGFFCGARVSAMLTAGSAGACRTEDFQEAAR